ncbi:MAG: hypothetical protein IJG24_08665, partial [Selenomonadaceae bacterium]|nr:hypothetical protein [Selenomonadaceae bacterium]
MLKPVLSYIAAHGLLAWPAFCPRKMPKDIMESMAQLLLNKGYIQKYSFGQYDTFYGLTKNFFDFVKSDNGRKFINAKRSRAELENVFFITDKAKFALVRSIYIYLYAIERGHGNVFFDVEFFHLAFRADFIGNEKHDLLLGCFWESADETEKFFKRLRVYLKTFKKIHRLFVVGLSLQHAKKMFDALEEIFAEDFPKNTDYYLYDADEDEFYRKDTLEVITPPEIWNTPSPPPKDDPEPEEVIDDEPEKVEDVPAVQKSEAPPLDMTVKEKVLTDVKALLADKKFYCATAYLRAQSLTLEAVEPLYRQLAFALDDPFLNESYSAGTISTLALQDDDDFNESLVTAAAIRALFYNDFGIDYGVPALHVLIKSFGLVKRNSPLAELIDTLKNFKTEQRKGIDLYADYQTKDRNAAEETLAKVIRDAEDYYSRYFEGKLTDRADNETFIRMEQNLFSRNGDWAQIFTAIKDKDEARSADTLNFVKDFLSETFIKKNAGFDRLNIDGEKLNQFIDDKWDEACGKKNPGKMIGRLRNNITKNLERAIEIMCAWVNCAEVLCAVGEDDGNAEYKRIRSRLLSHVETIISSLGDDAGSAVVAKTLKEISARLDGSY